MSLARRGRTSFWLEFDLETLELVRLRPMDRRGKVLRSPGELPSGPGTLIRVIEAQDERAFAETTTSGASLWSRGQSGTPCAEESTS